MLLLKNATIYVANITLDIGCVEEGYYGERGHCWQRWAYVGGGELKVFLNDVTLLVIYDFTTCRC